MALHLSEIAGSEVTTRYTNVEGNSAFNVIVNAVVAKYVEISDTEAPKAVRTAAINALADRVRDEFVKQLTSMLVNKTINLTVHTTEEPEVLELTNNNG